MIKLTPDEFHKTREAIAAAHLLIQSVAPLLQQQHRVMNREQRNLLTYCKQAVPLAFTTIATITHRENRDPDAPPPPATERLTDVDRLLFRDELENVSALILPDLAYEMVCALGELPMFHETLTAEPLTTHRTATLMAWCWEGGRRYGLQQALAIFDNTNADFKAGTDAAMLAALNATLELPVSEKIGPGSATAPENREPGPTLVTDDARSTDPAPFEHEEAKPTPKPN
jgi:hypothetical protein